MTHSDLPQPDRQQSDLPQSDDAPLVNDETFKAASHARYAELRTHGPVQRVRQPNGLDLFLVLDHDLARTALMHPDLRKDPEIARAALDAAGVTSYQGRGQGLGANMLMADPPDHARLRGPVARTFTPRRVEALRPRVQEITDALIDAIEAKAAAGEPIDLVEDFTAPLPVMVICELLGVPLDHQDDFRRWTLAAVAGSSSMPSPAQREGAEALNRYFAELLAEKSKDPSGEDLLCALIRLSREEEGALSDEELLGTAVILLVAGHETTVNLLGNATAALLDQPEQAALLRESPELLPGAVEEFLRFDAPVEQTPLRFAAQDVELGGVVIPQGTPVVVSLAAVGRDPQTGSDTAAALDRLDVTRTDVKHLSFGHGIHYCVGAPLARLEAVVALGTLLRRLPQLAPAVPYTELRWTERGIMHGPIALPASLSATEATEATEAADAARAAEAGKSAAKA
ncbi:cytochrome P450 family protein [Streptacidiphilus fuscans]|uniref:Cytochrome P450 n=1 Tax=Streptacidiphilus fuscans TaxID=2789292 RepID=A0A931BB25_9ACTN|nr:cytochrome P450 [Streptacidiphilus fuscans]MBF9070140.1 cytochrome P450 [Streptacidiphilus fuscans]